MGPFELPSAKKALALSGVLAGALLGTPAHADRCAPRTHASPCFDADALWMPAAASRFAAIPSATAEPANTLTLGFGATYLSRPVLLRASSPDPAGKTLRAVDDVVDANLSAAYSPVTHLELAASLPMALYRTGSSLVGVISQRGPVLPKTVLRDVRIGAGYDVLRSPPRKALGFGLMTRLDLTIPTGDETSFAGERSFVLSPHLAGTSSYRRFFFGTDQGVRVRRPVELGGRVLGSQFVSSLGAGVRIVDAWKLDLAVEAWVAPTVAQPEKTQAGGAKVRASTLVPAEWLGTARIRFGELSLLGGAGTALPLSTETRSDRNGGTEASAFAGMTSPRWRAVLVARYTTSPD